MYTQWVDRYNSEGILRTELLVTLKDRAKVRAARKHDYCLLCRADRVNEAGLCNACYSSLDGDELNLAVRWMAGVGP